jgi:hypothetical protein
MFPAATNGGGQAMGMPDVCKVPAPPAPPIPTPFPNIAMLPQAVGTSVMVKFGGKLVITQNSKVPMSSGDEAGVAGGVVSGMNIGACAFKMGVPTVKVEGNPVVTLLKPTGQNGVNANCMGTIVSPSQATIIING